MHPAVGDCAPLHCGRMCVLGTQGLPCALQLVLNVCMGHGRMEYVPMQAPEGSGWDGHDRGRNVSIYFS